MIDITIGSQKCLRGLTLNERRMIEQELTFDNPKYAQIMKYSKWGNTREPQYLEYFNYFHKDGELVMQVPVGYKIPDSIEINSILDDRRFVQVPNFPKFAKKLRDTQSQISKLSTLSLWFLHVLQSDSNDCICSHTIVLLVTYCLPLLCEFFLQLAQHSFRY